VRATIIYITGRSEPQLDWLIEDLEKQSQAHRGTVALELIVIDTRGRSAVEIGYRPTACITRLQETRPKPCVWQGPQRITAREWWAVANARNTGIALASTDYLVFLDDRCHLAPTWLGALRRAESERSSVVAGGYKKHENGKISVDHRLQRYPEGRRDCGGGWLYGCSVALPLAWLLDVNGFEEGVDSLSGEDYILGLMLAHHGRRVDFRPELGVIQERSVGCEHGLVRRDKGISPQDKSHAAIERFGRRRTTEFTPNLRALRAHLTAGGRFPDVDRAVEHRDWYDGQLIKDMEPPP